METALGILLFVLVYGPVAYLIYDEVTGHKSGVRRWYVRRAEHRAAARSSARATPPARTAGAAN